MKRRSFIKNATIAGGMMAKENGLKFKFGSDTRNQNAARLAYCKSVAKKCNLKAEEFYVPSRVV